MSDESELDKYLFDTWNMKETVHNRALANGIKKWHNKQVAAVLDELKEEGISCIDPAGHPTYVVPLSAIEQVRKEWSNGE